MGRSAGRGGKASGTSGSEEARDQGGAVVRAVATANRWTPGECNARMPAPAHLRRLRPGQGLGVQHVDVTVARGHGAAWRGGTRSTWIGVRGRCQRHRGRHNKSHKSVRRPVPPRAASPSTPRPAGAHLRTPPGSGPGTRWHSWRSAAAAPCQTPAGAGQPRGAGGRCQPSTLIIPRCGASRCGGDKACSGRHYARAPARPPLHIVLPQY